MRNRDPIARRVRRKKGFYKHLYAFVGVSLGLFILNIFSSDTLWFQYPAASWAIGLLVHYFTVFGLPGLGPADEAWEQEEYEREWNRMRRHYDELELPDDEIDLDEIPQLRREWKDSDLV